MKTLIILALLLFPLSAFGATIYINPDCATNGDIMAKSTEGGVTKTATIFPYSILS